jgi:hypothetical protein
MSSETTTLVADEEKIKIWALGDPWSLFFDPPENPLEEPSEELTIADLSVKGPRTGWDRLIVERPAEEIIYYRKRQGGVRWL